METETAVSRLAALAQGSRLTVFRLLVQKGPEGVAAGQIAEHLGIAPNTLSFHLKTLSHAGLLTSRQRGRHIHYAPDVMAMSSLLAYLTENCCADSATAAGCEPCVSCQEVCE